MSDQMRSGYEIRFREAALQGFHSSVREAENMNGWGLAKCLRMSYNMQPQILKRLGFSTVVCRHIAENYPSKGNVKEDIGFSLIKSSIRRCHLTTYRQSTTQLGCVTLCLRGAFFDISLPRG